MKSHRFPISLFVVSLLGGAVLIGCGAENTATKPADDPAPAVSPTATTVSFDVTKMTWPSGCAKSVRETLEGTDGVVKCDVDFPSKVATCEIDEAKFDQDAALAALSDAGFPSTVKE